MGLISQVQQADFYFTYLNKQYGQLSGKSHRQQLSNYDYDPQELFYRSPMPRSSVS